MVNGLKDNFENTWILLISTKKNCLFGKVSDLAHRMSSNIAISIDSLY